MSFFSENESQSYGEQDESHIAKRCKKRAPRKITGEWPDEKVYKLISIVKQRPTLYDTAVEGRKQSNTCLVWREVAEELGYNDWVDCRTKWQSLRVTFKTNLEKSRKKNTGQETSESMKVRWKFFDAMRFILNPEYVNSAESISNFVLKEESRCTSLSDEVPYAIATAQKQMRVCYEADTLAPSETQWITQNAEQALHPRRNWDEHAAFGDHIAAELRRLPSKDAHSLKRRLTRVLLDFWDEQDAK